MKNILIGSQALALQSNFRTTPNTDWDVVSWDSDLNIGENMLEIHEPDVLGNWYLENYLSDITVVKNGVVLHVCSLEGLALIKRSHLWREYKFERNMKLFNWYLKQHLNPADPYLAQRTKLTQVYFQENHPKLNVTVEQFFDDFVSKKYDHDWLHTLYAHEDEPLYKKMQKDSSKAWCEKNMWDNFSYNQKLQCIQEEAYVIATERFIAKDFSYPYKLAYYNAVNKICTTLCSGWFRDFALDNYESVLDAYNPDKVNSVISTLKETS